MRSFLRTLVLGGDDELGIESNTFLEIRALDPARHRGSGDISYHQSIDSALAAIHKWQPDTDVYFATTLKTRRRGLLEDSLRTHILWTDLDPTPTLPREELLRRLQRYPLPPSAIVDSGYGYHGYWLLASPVSTTIEDWAAVESALQAIRKVVEGDAVCDASRIMRVPGTTNFKDSAAPRPVRMVETGYSRKYALSDFLYVPAMLRDKKLMHKIWTGDTRGYQSRSERDWATLRMLVEHGLSDLAIITIFRNSIFPVGDKARGSGGARYFERSLKAAREQFGSPTPTIVTIKTKGRQPPVLDAENEAAPGEKSDVNEWGFQERADGLYRSQSKDNVVKVATFTFEPNLLLKSEDDREDVILGTITASGYTWEQVPLPRKAFTRVEALQRHLRIAAWQWLGSDKEVRLYLPYLMDKLRAQGLPHTRASTATGRHGDLWIAPGITFSATHVYDPMEAPLVHLPHFRDHRQLEYVFPSNGRLRPIKEGIRELLPNINRPEAIWPVIGWFFATPYKPSFESLNVRFPILSLFGTRGSGKTSLTLRVMLPLLGDKAPTGRDCNTTRFVTLCTLGGSTSVPVVFTEFRRASLGQRAAQTFLRYILISYDSGMDARGRADQTVQYYPLSAPMAVDGEDLISDPAARERIIAVDLDPKTIRENSDAYRAYAELVGYDLTAVAGTYIKYTLAQQVEDLWSEAHSNVVAAFPQSLPDRIRNNLSTVAAGIASYCDFFEYDPGPVVPFLHSVLKGALENVAGMQDIIDGKIVLRTPLFADELIEDVVNAVALKQAERYFPYKYYAKDNTLYFHLTPALGWWFVNRRRAGQDVLDKPAIKRQLKERTGQYVTDSKNVTVQGITRHMHGINITRAHAAGLEIPESLPSETEIYLKL